VKLKRRKIGNLKEFVSGSFLCAVGLFVFVLSLRLPIWGMTGPQEGFYPMVVAVIMIGTSIWVISKAFVLIQPLERDRMSDMGEEDTSNIFRLFSYALLLLLFSLFMEKVGFLASGMLFLVMILKYIEKQSWKTTLLISGFFIFFSYLIFVYFLGVPLPQTIPRFL